MSGPLTNARWERYCQGILAGMSHIDAYGSAGLARNEGRARRLRSDVQVRDRIAELCASSAQAVVQAISGSATDRQALVREGYAKLRERLLSIKVEDAQGWKALA